MLKTVIITLFTALAAAQTSTQVGSQTAFANSVQDFSTAGTTRPMAKGNTLPTTCAVGDQFFRSNATAGQNLYGCTAVNTWTQQAGGGGGGGGGAGGPQYDLVKASNIATLGGVSCTLTTPCVTTQNNVPRISNTAGVTCTLSGVPNNGTLLFYITSAGILTCGHNTTTTVTAGSGIQAATSTATFPADSCPMWSASWTANVFDTINIATMFKGNCYEMTTLLAGTGLTCVIDPTTGIKTCSVTGGSGGTDWQNFPMAGKDAGTSAAQVYMGAGGNGTIAQLTAVNGPNTLSHQNTVYLLAGVQFLFVAKQASPTWSASAGTVDISFYVINQGGAAGGEQWQLSAYVGCAAQGAAMTYGTATVITPSPTSTLGLMSHYEFTGLNLPASCAASVPMEFWIQRNADIVAGNVLNVGVSSVQITIRGN